MYYVIDDDKNLKEALDKEGVFALLEKAIEDGTLENIVKDSAFVSKLKCCVSGQTNKVAFVSQAKYNELQEGGLLEANALYFITDDTSCEDFETTILLHDERLTSLENRMILAENRLELAEKRLDELAYERWDLDLYGLDLEGNETLISQYNGSAQLIKQGNLVVANVDVSFDPSLPYIGVYAKIPTKYIPNNNVNYTYKVNGAIISGSIVADSENIGFAFVSGSISTIQTINSIVWELK